VPNARRVSVDLATIRFTDPSSGVRYVYLTPARGQAVLANFDLGVKPHPMDLPLGKPAQIVRSRKTLPEDGETKQERAKVAQARARQTARVTHSSQGAPTVSGGRTPPAAALSSTHGRRRTFGLRSLRSPSLDE